MREKALKAGKKPPLYVASCSFGKDSIATILLALEHKEPLDLVIFSEVMFCHKRGISGEQPEHIKWIYETAIPKLESMGVKVEVLRDERDYIELFFKKRIKGQRIGMFRGFPLHKRCYINSDLKIAPIKKLLKLLNKDYQVIQYIGIAVNETERLQGMKVYENKISLLEKYRFTESMTKDKCLQYNLLSPVYQRVTRGGCWFCPNCKTKELSFFRKNYPDLWDELRQMGKTPNIAGYAFKNKLTFEEIEKRIDRFEMRENKKNKSV